MNSYSYLSLTHTQRAAYQARDTKTKTIVGDSLYFRIHVIDQCSKTITISIKLAESIYLFLHCKSSILSKLSWLIFSQQIVSQQIIVHESGSAWLNVSMRMCKAWVR